MTMDVEKRSEVILDQASQVFNRLDTNISSFGGKISSFFQTLLALITVQASLIVIVLNNGRSFSKWSYFLLLIFFFLICISVILSIYLLRPREFRDLEIFEKNRFITLLKSDKKQLLSDFLYHIKICYEYNDRIYNENIQNLIRLYYIFFIGNIVYILLIISMFMK
jgi:hypothetical protein